MARKAPNPQRPRRLRNTRLYGFIIRVGVQRCKLPPFSLPFVLPGSFQKISVRMLRSATDCSSRQDKDNDLVLEDGFQSIAADVEELRSRCRLPLTQYQKEVRALGQFFLTPTFNIFVRHEPRGCGNLDPV